MYLLEETERPTSVPTTYGEAKKSVVDWGEALAQCNINKQEAKNSIMEVLSRANQSVRMVQADAGRLP